MQIESINGQTQGEIKDEIRYITILVDGVEYQIQEADTGGLTVRVIGTSMVVCPMGFNMIEIRADSY